VLDLKKSAARDVLKRLVARADVLLENYRHDTLAKLGLGYEALRKVNSGLIYCAISGSARDRSPPRAATTSSPRDCRG